MTPEEFTLDPFEEFLQMLESSHEGGILERSRKLVIKMREEENAQFQSEEESDDLQ